MDFPSSRLYATVQLSYGFGFWVPQVNRLGWCVVLHPVEYWVQKPLPPSTLLVIFGSWGTIPVQCVVTAVELISSELLLPALLKRAALFFFTLPYSLFFVRQRF